VADLGAQGRALVRDLFGVDRMVADSLRLYYWLLRRRRSHQFRRSDLGSWRDS